MVQNEHLTELELEVLKRKLDFFDLRKKSTQIGFGVILGISLIVPLIPSKYAFSTRKFPNSLSNYLEQLNRPWIYLFLIILLVYVYQFTRLSIEINSGIRKDRISKIIGIINLGIIKILLLDNISLFVLNDKNDEFDIVKKNQKLKTSRTITYRLLRYNLSD